MKKPTWFSDLVAYIDGHERTGFAYGAHDCALNVAGMIEAMTGVDHAKPWRGRYKTLAGGLKAMKKAGFADHFDYVQKTFPEVPVSFAGNGDIAAVRIEGNWSLGCFMNNFIYVLTPVGMGILPRSQAEKAFKVE